MIFVDDPSEVTRYIRVAPQVLIAARRAPDRWLKIFGQAGSHILPVRLSRCRHEMLSDAESIQLMESFLSFFGLVKPP